MSRQKYAALSKLADNFEKVSYFKLLASKLNDKVQKVRAEGQYLESQKPGDLVPVFITDPETDVGIFFTEPCLAVRFGNFDENPYQTNESRVNYVTSLLGKDSQKFNIFVPGTFQSVKNKVKNRNYTLYVLITYGA